MQKFHLSYQTRKLKTAMITLLIFGIMFPFIGVGLCADTLSPISAPIDISSVSPEAIEFDTIYKFDELYVADVYAEYTENERLTNRVLKVTEQCFLCMLVTDTGIYTLSVQTKPTDDIMPAINSYLENDEQFLGDLAIDGYFKASELAGDIKQFYDEAVTLYEDYELYAVPLHINLIYECNGDADYIAFATKQKQQQRLISLVFTGIGIFCLICSYFAKKFYKKQLAIEAEKARSWTTEEE